MALTLDSVSPESGTIDVPLNQHFVLTFNTEIDDAYLSNQEVSQYFQLFKDLNNDSNNPAWQKQGVEAGKLTTNPTQTYIKPISNLDPNYRHMLLVMGMVANTSGETLGSNVPIYFTTGDTLLDPEVVISNLEVIVNSTIGDPDNPDIYNPPPDSGDTPTNSPDVTTPSDTSNIVESESGTSGIYIEGNTISFSDPPVLFIESSEPDNKSVGILDLSNVNIYWSKDIIDVFGSNVTIQYSNLPCDRDVFGNRNFPITLGTIAGNLSPYTTDPLSDPNYIDPSDPNYDQSKDPYNTLNKEYFITIPPGAFKDDLDNKNSKTIIRFMGELSPMFASPFQILSMLDPDINPLENTNYDLYTIYKTIHRISYEIQYEFGITPDITGDKLFWICKYVACRVAMELTGSIVDIGLYVSSRKVLGQSVSYSLYPNVKEPKNKFQDCMDKALRELDLAPSSTAPYTGVKSGKSLYYPGRSRISSENLPRSNDIVVRFP